MATKTLAGPKLPRFFKAFIAHRSSLTLEIPRSYVRFLEVRGHKYVHLIGPSGDTCGVKLISNGGRLYLQQGWMEFVKCNSLRDMDILVFKYDGYMNFKVRVLDFRSCMNRLAFDAKGGQGLNNSEECRRNEMEEGNGAEVSPHGHLKQVKEEPRDACSFAVFTVIMRKYHVSSTSVVRVPAWIVRQHFSGYGAMIKIVLQNSKGNKQWPVKLSFKSGSITGGWSGFVCDNRIAEGDTCMFELVQKFKMLVHISRQRAPSQSNRSKRPAILAEPEEFDANKRYLVSEHGDVIVCPISSGLLNRRAKQAHVSDGAQKVAEIPSRGRTKLTAEQNVAKPAAKEFPSRTVPVRKCNVQSASIVEKGSGGVDIEIEPQTYDMKRKGRSEGHGDGMSASPKLYKRSEDDEIARRVQAATKRVEEELQEQKEKTDKATSEIAQLREENRKIMQMLQGKHFGRDASH